jgi:hypothetical protein
MSTSRVVGIEPFVTPYYWDLPPTIEGKYGVVGREQQR